MSKIGMSGERSNLFSRIAEYSAEYRAGDQPVNPTGDVQSLRDAFFKPLPQHGRPGEEVIRQLITAAEPGLVGNTDPNFYAWVMGASDPIGVAADWLTSVWGQNSAIYQTAPAAAIAEEAVSKYLLDLLDLPRESSVGFVTGATMAAFVGLAAARASVLEQAGHDFYEDGLQGAPKVSLFVSDDIHVTNLASIRYLGFGKNNIIPILSDDAGLMQPTELKKSLDGTSGPKIIITQAGHINSGGFEDFHAISELARAHQAWVHVDGAFGLWARVLEEKSALTDGIDLADSWSIDGHKWLQLPYESGFVIVKNADAHRKAMGISAGYLSRDENDGRNPTEFNPELSRRARGFVAWAVLQHLGREGVEEIIRRHCEGAKQLADRLSKITGVRVVNQVELNQVVIELTQCSDDKDRAVKTQSLAEDLNENGLFVRVVNWKGKTMLRFSIISQNTGPEDIERLGNLIASSVQKI